jgi:hypothetical protein
MTKVINMKANAVHRKKYIRQKFLFYRRAFANNELPELIRNAALEHCKGALFGLLDGILTGIALGGKWGGNGGWVAGAVTQLLALIVSPFVSGVHGFVVGLLTSRVEVSDLMKDYRYSFGSVYNK